MIVTSTAAYLERARTTPIMLTIASKVICFAHTVADATPARAS